MCYGTLLRLVTRAVPPPLVHRQDRGRTQQHQGERGVQCGRCVPTQSEIGAGMERLPTLRLRDQ
jgi:hypothetical protein